MKLQRFEKRVIQHSLGVSNKTMLGIDLLLLWLVNKFFPEKPATTSDGESMENWIILEDLEYDNFSFTDNVNNAEEYSGHDHDSCDFDL